MERLASGLKIAVVGAGVAGITAAHLLSRSHDVTLYEQNDYLGGHTNTILVEERPGVELAVDTGFIVCNNRNYPYFYKLLDELEITLRNSDMSFGFYCERSNLGYVGPGLFDFIKQWKNFLNPKFLGLIREQQRFNKRTLRDLREGMLAEIALSEYLKRYNFSDYFIENYLLPISAAIWSSPDNDMLKFPVATFAAFFNNHGMLELSKRPTWQTVVGGSFQYVKAFEKRFKGAINKNCKIASLTRTNKGVTLKSAQGQAQTFDRVVLASHANQSLALLEDANQKERELLGSWKYHPNIAVLHTDSEVMPKNKKLWASWNYLRKENSSGAEPISITYYMNRLQGLKTDKDYFVTLNQSEKIRKECIIRSINYSHPAYNTKAIKTQAEIEKLNGNNNTFFCGSYLGYGFHEDAVSSAVSVARKLGVLV